MNTFSPRGENGRPRSTANKVPKITLMIKKLRSVKSTFSRAADSLVIELLVITDVPKNAQAPNPPWLIAHTDTIINHKNIRNSEPSARSKYGRIKYAIVEITENARKKIGRILKNRLSSRSSILRRRSSLRYEASLVSFSSNVLHSSAVGTRPEFE